MPKPQFSNVAQLAFVLVVLLLSAPILQGCEKEQSANRHTKVDFSKPGVGAAFALSITLDGSRFSQRILCDLARKRKHDGEKPSAYLFPGNLDRNSLQNLLRNIELPDPFLTDLDVDSFSEKLDAQFETDCILAQLKFLSAEETAEMLLAQRKPTTIGVIWLFEWKNGSLESDLLESEFAPRAAECEELAAIMRRTGHLVGPCLATSVSIDALKHQLRDQADQ